MLGIQWKFQSVKKSIDRQSEWAGILEKGGVASIEEDGFGM